MITLNPGEKIYVIKRRHRIVLLEKLVPEFFICFLIILGIIALFFIFSPSWPEALADFFPRIEEFNLRYILLFFLFHLLLIFWLIIFVTFANYYLDFWIVTNQRTIHTELHGLFNRSISSVPNERIQDITIHVKGILPTILRFGDLHIQTAGEFREFIFRQIPDPYKTKETIFKALRDASVIL